MMRLRYPAVVDMAYSASAPTLLYAQQVDPSKYYAVVTRSAERAVPGCPDAVRAALAEILALPSKAEVAAALGLCLDASATPAYIKEGDLGTLQRAVSMVVMYSFADLNMGNYPPTKDAALARACDALVAQPSALGLKAFLLNWAGASLTSTSASGTTPSTNNGTRTRTEECGKTSHQSLHDDGRRIAAAASGGTCYNLSTQLPGGRHPTISAGDWSGVGTGANGLAWDYQTCTLLVERIATNNVTDMFPPRNSTLEWLEQHCLSRFGVTPQPHALVDLWGFDRLQDVTSRIIFTNGLNDGWSAGSVLTNLSDSLIAINMPNGAHHSDLSHSLPGPQDTPDVTAGRAQAAGLLSGWLAEIRGG